MICSDRLYRGMGEERPCVLDARWWLVDPDPFPGEPTEAFLCNLHSRGLVSILSGRESAEAREVGIRAIRI